MADLTTLANVKSYLSLTTEDNARDALLTRLITAASNFIETILNRVFASADYTVTLNGNGTYYMMLPNYPVSRITSVNIDGQNIPASTGFTEPGWFLANDCVCLRGYIFREDNANVVVAYTAGFGSTPAVIEDACIELVARKYKYKDRVGESSKVVGGMQVNYEAHDLTDEMKSVLRNFQKVVPV